MLIVKMLHIGFTWNRSTEYRSQGQVVGDQREMDIEVIIGNSEDTTAQRVPFSPRLGYFSMTGEDRR